MRLAVRELAITEPLMVSWLELTMALMSFDSPQVLTLPLATRIASILVTLQPILMSFSA